MGPAKSMDSPRVRLPPAATLARGRARLLSAIPLQLHGSTAMIRHAPRMVTDDLLALRHAAVAGIGIVHLPSVVVRDEIAAGQLVELVPGWAPKSGVIHAIFPSRRGLLPSVRTLIDFLGEEFSLSYSA